MNTILLVPRQIQNTVAIAEPPPPPAEDIPTEPPLPPAHEEDEPVPTPSVR